MGRAICVQCAAPRSSGLSACAACGFDPAGNDVARRTQALSLWLSDGHLSPAELDAAAKQIARGEAPSVDPAALEALLRQLETQGLPTIATPRGLALMIWVPFGLVVALTVFALWFFAYRT